jgi:hypothetical protein
VATSAPPSLNAGTQSTSVSISARSASPCSSTRDGPRPLSADVYEGHTIDATRFPAALTALRHRVEQRVGQRAALTLVYDKGHKAKAKQALVDELPVHYVAARVPSQPPALTALLTTAYTPSLNIS